MRAVSKEIVRDRVEPLVIRNLPCGSPADASPPESVRGEAGALRPCPRVRVSGQDRDAARRSGVPAYRFDRRRTFDAASELHALWANGWFYYRMFFQYLIGLVAVMFFLGGTQASLSASSRHHWMLQLLSDGYYAYPLSHATGGEGVLTPERLVTPGASAAFRDGGQG